MDSRMDSSEARVTWADGHVMPVEMEHVNELIAWRAKLSMSPVVRVEVRTVSPWQTREAVLVCPECGREVEMGGHEGSKHGWRYCESAGTWVAPPGYDGEGRENPCLAMVQQVTEAVHV